ncbi:unnamed protein product, partial [marine sediment metagenome]
RPEFALLYHLKIKEIKVIIIDWSALLSPRALKHMRRHLKEQRKKFL